MTTLAARPLLVHVPITTQIVVHNRQELKTSVVNAMIADPRPPRVVVDLQHVRYLDASGLGVLVQLRRRAREAGGVLVVCNLSDDLRTLWELTRMDVMVPAYADLAAATEALAL